MTDSIVSKTAVPMHLWNKSYIMILFINAFTGIASMVVTPLVSQYAVSIGASLTAAGTIYSIMPLAALLCRPFSGLSSDRFNRKNLLIMSTFITSVSVAGYALTSSIQLLVIMRTVHGIAFSFMTVANMAFATSYIPKEKIGEGLGYLALSNILAQAVGPGMGLYIAENMGFNVSFFIAGGASIIGVAFMFLIPYKYHPVKASERKRFSLDSIIAKDLLLYTLMVCLFSCGNGLLNTYVAMLGAERGIANIGLLFTSYSIMLIFVRPLSGKLLDKKGLAYVLFPAFVIAAVGMVFVGAAVSVWMIVAAGILKALGQGAGTPSIQAHCVKALGHEKAGVASSTCFIGQDVGNAIAPIIGGFVVTSCGYSTLFYGYAGVLAVVGCLLYALQRYLEKRKQIRSSCG